MISGVVPPPHPSGDPEWSAGPLRMRGGRLSPPGRELWAWSAQPIAWHYWSRWTVGATRGMRGWFGGGRVSTVAFDGAEAGTAYLWSACRWLPDDGRRRSAEELADLGREVAELCRRLGLDRTKGSPGSVGVAAMRPLGRTRRVPHDQNEWSHEAIYGGRNEAWRVGASGPCVQWDRSSAYVAHLAEPLPLAWAARWTETPSLAEEGVSDATVVVPDTIEVPPLPVRARCREGTRTVYPHGRMRGRWCHEELRAAAERGCRVTLHAGYVYPAQALVGPYQAFASLVWRLRRAHPLVKRVGVGLVGRMHSGLENRRVVPLHLETTPPDEESLRRFLGAEALILDAGNRTGADRRLDVALMRQVSETWAPYVDMPAAAHILARARLELLCALEANRDRVLACATDGMILDGHAPPSWHRPDAVRDGLGGWRLDARAESCELVGPVHYRLTFADGSRKQRCSGLLREKVDAFLAGHVADQVVELGLECGPAAGRRVRRKVDPRAVSITGGRVDGRPPVVELRKGVTVVVS